MGIAVKFQISHVSTPHPNRSRMMETSDVIDGVGRMHMDVVMTGHISPNLKGSLDVFTFVFRKLSSRNSSFLASTPPTITAQKLFWMIEFKAIGSWISSISVMYIVST